MSYFYCKHDDTEQRDPVKILQALLHRIFLSWCNYRLPECITTVYRKRQKDGFSSGALGFEECQGLLTSTLELFLEATLFIDALDEIDPEKRGEILDALRKLVETHKTVKIFLSSRVKSDINIKFDGIPRIYIEATNNRSEITQFVNQELDRALRDGALLAGEISVDLKQDIASVLCEKADGM